MDQRLLQQITAAGFKPANVSVPRRLIASVDGHPKEGKTHFALTFPAPIFFFDIDIGTEGVVEKFKQQGKDIWVYSIRVPKGQAKTAYENLWNDAKQKMKMAWDTNEGTVIVDTGTEGYELSRLSHFGKLTQVMPHHYVEVNAEWRELVRLAYDATNMSTLFIHKLKSKWVNNTRTGEYEVAGPADIEYGVQANITAYTDPLAPPGTEPFRIHIRNCRQNPKANGVRLSPPMNTADFVMKLVHGG